MKAIVPVERIEKKILLIRGEKVMMDADLAALYGVETKMLNRAVKRNLDRFPEDFMFRLSKDEAETLKFHFGASKLISQSGASRKGRGGSHKMRPPQFWRIHESNSSG